MELKFKRYFCFFIFFTPLILILTFEQGSPIFIADQKVTVVQQMKNGIEISFKHPIKGGVSYKILNNVPTILTHSQLQFYKSNSVPVKFLNDMDMALPYHDNINTPSMKELSIFIFLENDYLELVR